jgi:SOS-response transcriptional repressor LexA
MKDSLKPKELLLMRTVAAWEGPCLVKQLATKLKYSGESSVRYVVAPLERRGLVKRVEVGDLVKSLELTNAGRAELAKHDTPAHPMRVLAISARRLEQPLPISSVHCGAFKPAAEEPAGWIEYVGDIFPNYQPGDQVLEAEGDSMVSPNLAEESIYAGDRCLMRPGEWPYEGEVVYVRYLLDNGQPECTMKEWHPVPNSNRVRLVPRNPAYEVIEREVEELRVEGIVLDIIHTVSRRRCRITDRKVA